MLINASKIMKFVVLSNAIMAFIFFNFLLKRISIPAIISLVASSLFFLLPIEKFVTKLFVKEIERGDSGNYYDYYKRFKHYDLLNPVTKARGASRLEGNSLRDAIRRWIINRIKVSFVYSFFSLPITWVIESNKQKWKHKNGRPSGWWLWNLRS